MEGSFGLKFTHTINYGLLVAKSNEDGLRKQVLLIVLNYLNKYRKKV